MSVKNILTKSRVRKGLGGTAIVAAIVAVSLASAPIAASAATTSSYSSDTNKPNLVTDLSGFNSLWTSSGLNNLQGTVNNASALEWNDEVTSWINQNATANQQFRALQNSAYLNSDGSGYDQSISIADGLGSALGAYYVQGREDGSLPLTSALINSSTGTSGAYVSTGTAKATFSYPRPYLAASSTSTAVAGDAAACAPSLVNGSSLTGIRLGQSWANSDGSLKITRVAATTDTTHEFATTDVTLDASYGAQGLCTGGAFPSGHTTSAYEAGFTLATLLPELAPEILARASEAGNNRIVLGVHYALDIIGGRIDGEAALASRWSDSAYVTNVLAPARAELVSYLEKKCGNTLAVCIANDTPYTDNPYNGNAIPGGTSQIVTDEASALSVYTERLTYGFTPTSATNLAASVPTGAENLLLTSFPTLTDTQRISVLAQTEISSGNPLDTSATGTVGSWQRLNLAAAMSAKVQLNTDGTVTVLSTGTTAQVVTETSNSAAPSSSASSSAASVSAPTAVAAASSSTAALVNTSASSLTSLVAWAAGILALGMVLVAVVAVPAIRRRKR